MKHKVIIHPQAKSDIKEIYLFVALHDSVLAADRLLDSLEETLNSLELFPERGHIPPELAPTGIKTYLEIHYKPYRIIYEIVGKQIYVHCVLDGRRNILEILSNRFLR